MEYNLEQVKEKLVYECDALGQGIRRLETEMKDVVEALTSKRRDLIKITCPYHIGQRIRSSASGVYEITRIEPKIRQHFYRLPHDEFEIFGRKVLRNGTLHSTERLLWEHELKEVLEHE